MTDQHCSYIGQHVYVGIDVHKDTYTVTCLHNKRIVKMATVPADPPGLTASLLCWCPGARLATVYEAGFSACVLHRTLIKGGITNIVVHPASVAVVANNKVKTDRRDSKKLALDLADGRLRGIYVPTEAEELARLLPRTRAQLVAHRATLARQMKAKLHQFGLITPASRRLLSHRYLREIAAWPLPAELHVSLTLLAEALSSYRKKITHLCSKERTIEGFGLSRTPLFSLFPPPQLSSGGRRLGAIFINLIRSIYQNL